MIDLEDVEEEKALDNKIETIIIMIERDLITRIMMMMMIMNIVDLMVEEWTEVDIKCKEEEESSEVEK